MFHLRPGNFPLTYCLSFFTLLFFFGIPVFGSEPIEGFRDLKFGMSPQEVQTVQNCSTPTECIYELSNKNRYLTLSYGSGGPTPDTNSNQSLRLEKITIDMGQYSEGWYHQLQTILGTSYRLTHDFTDEQAHAFLGKHVEELLAGYEDGQVVLVVKRRPFGNMTLNVIYQIPSLASEFIRQRQVPPNSSAIS